MLCVSGYSRSIGEDVMDYSETNVRQRSSHGFDDVEFVFDRPADKPIEVPPDDTWCVGAVSLHTGGIADRNAKPMPTSIARASEVKGQVSLSHLADLQWGHVSNAMAKTMAHAAFFEGGGEDVARLLQRNFAITDRQMRETVDPFIAIGIAQRAWQAEGSLATEIARWRSGDTHFIERVEDAFIAMLPAHWRRGESWALSLSKNDSLGVRIGESAKALLPHFERDTLDFIHSLPEEAADTIAKFVMLYSMIAQVREQSAWFDLWQHARAMPWYAQPALMHRLAARLRCTVISAAERTKLIGLYDRWRAYMAANCIGHDSCFLLARGYAAVIEALSHLSAFDAPFKMQQLRLHVASALREIPVHAQAEVLDVLFNLDLSKLGPGGDALTQRVLANLRYLIWDPLSKATCPSARFTEALCDTAIRVWHALPDSGDTLDDQVTGFCTRFDLSAEHAVSLRFLLNVDCRAVSRHSDQSITPAPMLNPAEFDVAGSAHGTMAAKL